MLDQNAYGDLIRENHGEKMLRYKILSQESMNQIVSSVAARYCRFPLDSAQFA